MNFARFNSLEKLQKITTKVIQWLKLHTVRTVAADLRRGEHIPKMQNNIGRKSALRVLRQQRSKDGGEGGGGFWMPYRAVSCRAARGSARCWVLHNCRRFTLDRIRKRQKHHGVLDPSSFGTLIWYSTNCAKLTLCKELVFKHKIFIGSLSDIHSVIYWIIHISFFCFTSFVTYLGR